MGLLRRLSLKNSSTEPLKPLKLSSSKAIPLRKNIYGGEILVRTEKKTRGDKQEVEVPAGLEIVMSRGEQGFSTVYLPFPSAGIPSDLKTFLTSYNPQTLRITTYNFRNYLTKEQDFSGRVERQIDQTTWPTTFEAAVNAVRESARG